MNEWWQDKEQLKTYIGKWIDDMWTERETIEAERAQHGITVAALKTEIARLTNGLHALRRVSRA